MIARSLTKSLIVRKNLYYTKTIEIYNIHYSFFIQFSRITKILKYEKKF